MTSLEHEVAKYYFKPKPFWDDIPTPVHDELKAHSVTTGIKKGGVVYTEGTYPKGLYILTKGIAKLYTLNHLGQEQIIYMLGKNEMFGYRSIACNNNSIIYITAIEDCEIELIDRDTFVTQLFSSTELNKVFMNYFGEEFRILYQKISVFGLKPVTERFALTLLILNQKFNAYTEGPQIVRFMKKDIANYAGMAIETLSRQLNHLRALGAVENRGGNIILKDLDVLFKIANIA